MAIRRMLTQRIKVLSGSETIDPATRRPVASSTVIARDVPAALVKRSDASTVYDETGDLVTDYDCLTTAQVSQGDVVVVTRGAPTGRFVVTGEPRMGVDRLTGRVHHVTAPCRRIG